MFQQSGGLIGRVDRALDEFAETRRLAARSVFYMQWLSLILALQTGQVGYDLLRCAVRLQATNSSVRSNVGSRLVKGVVVEHGLGSTANFAYL